MPTDLDAILKLTVPVIVNIGRRDMRLEDVLGLVPGAIIELTKTADEPLDLLVNNKPIGRGAAVKVGENLGIRIGHIGSAEERIEAMGEE